MQDLALAFPALLLKSAAAGPGEPREGLATTWDGDTLDLAHSISSVVQSEHPARGSDHRQVLHQESQPHCLVGFLLESYVALHSMAGSLCLGSSSGLSEDGTRTESGLPFKPPSAPSFYFTLRVADVQVQAYVWLRSPSTLVPELMPDSGHLALALGSETHIPSPLIL